MNKKVVRLLVLGAVFLASIFIFSLWINKENKERTSSMPEAKLPLVNFVYAGTEVNELHGYVNEMNPDTIRDAITPIGNENQLQMEILSPNMKVDNIAYEVRSMEDHHLLIDDDKADYMIEGDKLKCRITLPNLIESGKEYNMTICLTAEGKEIYYYTRLLYPKESDVDDSVDFALQFHQYTFREDAEEFIPTYMDAATGDTTTLHYVDLTCTLGQVAWADFHGSRLTEPRVFIEEITASYNVITLQYVMTHVNEHHEVEYFNVEEYYRLRKTPNRMYVLNFERRMNQIFRFDNTFIRKNSELILGIRDSKIEYMASESGDNIAFVQEGELWTYDRVNHSITQIFSFRGLEGINKKENWNQHDIHIIKMDEAGSVDFVVLGYMNRGHHEGEVGIGVYHYDGISHSVEEQIFISSTKSYDALKVEVGDLFYVNEQKILHIVMNDTRYEIDLNTHTVKAVLEHLEEFEYAVSESGRYIAWIDCEEGEHSESIFLEDLKTGIVHEVKGEVGTYLRPLAFLGEDFIYGIAKKEDVKTDIFGTSVFPMNALKIMDTYESQKEIIKTYRPSNGYVKSIALDGSNIYVQLMVESEGGYQAYGKDIIMNREEGGTGSVKVSTMVTEQKQTQMLLTMKTINFNKAVEKILSDHIIEETHSQTITLDDFSGELYYVYVRGTTVLATKNVSEAIAVANQNYGIVVDQNREYIWKRDRATTKAAWKNVTCHENDMEANTITKCVSAILQKEDKNISVEHSIMAGQSPKSVLENALTNAKVLQLNECRTEELLYFIAQGTPVLAYVSNEDAILLTGYTANQLYYYDPMSNTEGFLSFEEAEEKFALGGFHYIVYVK